MVLCNLDLHTGEKKNGIYVKRFLRKIIDDQLVGSIQFQLWNLGWFLPITCSKITIIYWPLNNQNRCVTRTFDSVFTSLIQGLYRFLDPKSTTFSRLLPKTINFLPFFPDFVSIFQTFSRSGKLLGKFQDYYKNSRSCTSPAYKRTYFASDLFTFSMPSPVKASILSAWSTANIK